MASCNSWQYLVTILAKIFPRSWQDLAKILLRYPWKVDPGKQTKWKKQFTRTMEQLQKINQEWSLENCHVFNSPQPYKFLEGEARNTIHN